MDKKELAELCRGRGPDSLMAFYEWAQVQEGFKLPPHLMPHVLGLTDERIDKFMVQIGPGSGKALSPETPVLTQRGWISIQDCTTQDSVVQPDGRMSRIVGVWPQEPSQLWKFTFADGREVTANDQHIWKVRRWNSCWTLQTTQSLRENPGIYFIPKAQISPIPADTRGCGDLRILEISPGPIDPSVCISIENPDGLFLCGDYIVTHNSQLLSVVYPAWELGGNPETTIVGVSGAEGLAAGFMDATARIIENTEAFQMSFPEVRPDKGTGWSTGRGYYVTGRRPTVPDASYWAGGLSSKELTGKHGTLIILDDLHDDQNSSTEAQCQQVVNRYATQLVGRADAKGARFILAGRRWNEKDLYGFLQNNGDWVCLTLPAERPGSQDLWVDITVPEGLECVFTDGLVYTSDDDVYVARDSVPAPWKITEHENGVRIRHIRWKYGEDYMKQGFFWPDPDHPSCKKKGPGNEPKRKDYYSVKRLSPSKAEAVYQCNPGARQGIVFVDSDFDRRFRPPQNIAAGVHDPEVKRLIASGAMVIQSWDTAFSANSTSDFTVCTTALLIECDQYHNGEEVSVLGSCDGHYDVLLLDVYREQVAFGDLTRKVREMHQKWHPSVIVVEKKAYGVTIVETLTNAGLPIVAVSPNSLESKRARAVEGVGAGSVQGWCRQGRCIFPDVLPDGTELSWFAPFKREMKDFTGEPGNKDDQVDSYVHLVRWAIQNGGSFAKIGDGGWDSPNGVDQMMGANRGNTLAAALGIDMDAPEMRTCASCRYYQYNKCANNMHPMPTLSISTCDDHAYQGEDTSSGLSFQSW